MNTESERPQTGQNVAPVQHSEACPRAPKWAAVVDDNLVLLPKQHVTAEVIKQQTGTDPELVLVRDLGSTNDVPFENNAELDLAAGNVFYTLPRCEVKPASGCDAPPKLAFVINDQPEQTLNPRQTGRSLRELFGFALTSRLFRDYESPNDEAIGLDDIVHFSDGPVFYTRRAEIGLTIIVNKQTFGQADGVKERMTGREIAGLVSPQPDNTEVTRDKGKERIPVGLNETVEIKGCEEFSVIRTNVVGGFEPTRIQRELGVLRENGGEVTFVESPVACAVYHRLPARKGYPHIAETDVLVSIPSAYPGVMLDGAYLPTGSPLLGKVEGSPQGHTIQALGRTWQLVSYHPHNGGGGPPWNKDRHGLQTYYTEILSWIQRARV
ncbi:MAG: E2/UBC family protein [Verrucomicrobiota bacterium]